MPQDKLKIEVSEREAKLIYLCRSIKFGRMELDIRDGLPTSRIPMKEKKFDLDKMPLDKIKRLIYNGK